MSEVRGSLRYLALSVLTVLSIGRKAGYRRTLAAAVTVYRRTRHVQSPEEWIDAWVQFGTDLGYPWPGRVGFLLQQALIEDPVLRPGYPEGTEVQPVSLVPL